MTIPTRADIALLIATVPVASSKKDKTRAKIKKRNEDRHNVVKSYVKDIMKDERSELPQRILDDLESYVGWEREDVEDA